MEKYIAYDADWQTPAKTEQYVYDCLKESEVRLEGAVYVAFPWASLIDGLARDTDLGHRLLHEYEKIVLQLKYITAKRVVSVCQHIKFRDYAHLFQRAGITDLFVSHKEKKQTNLGAINLYALQLFPVQASTEVKENLCIPNQNTNWIDREFLYSFVGAYDGRYYLTNSRQNIFDYLSDKGGLITERTSWHYQARVYDEQVYGRELSAEYLTEEQKNAIEYIDVLLSSKFSLCPSGTGPNSIRLWESIEYGSIPVILADTLDFPGDKNLWKAACVFVEETSEAIKSIPSLLKAIVSDKKIYQKKLEALEELKTTLGIRSFENHIVKSIENVISQTISAPKIILDCSMLSSGSIDEWLLQLTYFNEIYANRFMLFTTNLPNDVKASNEHVKHVNNYSPDFKNNFVVVFDSKTISNALLSKFETIIVKPQKGPKILSEYISPLTSLAKKETSVQQKCWSPICTLITSMFNGDEYKGDFLENTSKFQNLIDVELMIFRPESRDSEHFDLLEFGVQHNSLVYVWLAKDPGLYDVWNLGVRLSSSNYISNANIDDKRGPGHITKLTQALTANTNCDVGSTALRVTDTKNLKWEDSVNETVWYKPPISEVYNVKKITKFNEELGLMQAHNIPHCMPVWRAKLHRKFGYFEEKRFGPSSDWEFWLRCGIQGTNFYLLNEDHGLYYRAPQSYWRRDPNAKNYDFLIANEHFEGEKVRTEALSRSVNAFELNRLIHFFKEGDFYVGLSHLFSFIASRKADLTEAEANLLNRLCENYLCIALVKVTEAVERLSPVMSKGKTFIDLIGFCLRATSYLPDFLFKNYVLLADKLATNEDKLCGWLVKAKIYALRGDSVIEANCLAAAYNVDPYDFWCNVNRIYGLEKSLSYLISTLENDTDVPKICDFSWLRPGKKLYYLPDYSHGNPYQGLLYQNFGNRGVEVKGLSEPDSINLDVDLFDEGDVLHIHWINILFKGHTKDTITPVLESFLAKLNLLKGKGVNIIWTVHNRQNHEEIDLEQELNFRANLALLCDSVLLHHPMLAFELSHWLPSVCNIEIVEHGLYTGFYPNSIGREDAVAALGCHEDTIKIGTLGQIREYKSLPSKIDAVKTANEITEGKIEYLIAGKVSCSETLVKAKEATNLVLHNRFISDEEVQVYLKACDYVLLSYRDILTSGSYFQAATFETPCIAPSLGSLNYYIVNGINGYHYSNELGLRSILTKLDRTTPLLVPAGLAAVETNWPTLEIIQS